MNKKNISNKSLFMIIFMVLSIIVLGTYAWFTWSSNQTALVLTIGDLGNLNITLSPYKINTSVTPTTTYEDNEYTQINAINSSNTNEYKITLYYQINSIDTELKNNSFKYMILSSEDNITYTEYLSGDFSGASSDSKYIILEDELLISNSTKYYRIYLWIDSTTGDQSTMQGKIFNAELRADYESSAEPVAPVLDEGMIPVMISDNGTVTTISENDKSWYNYKKQQWANAILVKDNDSQIRNYYKENIGVEVNQDDILAYYVWIPRYRYKIWTTGVSSKGSEQSIDIIWEQKNDIMTLGTTVDSWRTHPAFWWDANNNSNIDYGETLSGIWVGKFETSSDKTSTCYNDTSRDNCDNSNQEPKILPNANSLIYQSISNQFVTSLKFAGGSMTDNMITFTGSETYGLSATTNSHMMKNSEWGAVAYLSHSKYGINTEIRVNNYYNNGYLTGCGAATPEESASTSCGIVYGSGVSSYPQSTTGNISGAFDMSGGTFENVMGNRGNNVGTSGFDSEWFTTVGNSKYYDLYSATEFTGDTTSDYSYCKIETCGGQALNETKSWYGDSINFITSSLPWFRRGSWYDAGSYSGIFTFYNLAGASYNNVSFRSTLITDELTEEKPIRIYYNVNGGTITETTDGGTFTTDDTGTILKNGNAVYNSIEYGSTLGSAGLNNYDNSAYMNIIKSGYFVIAGTEWNTSNDGSGKIFDDVTSYSYSDFINYATEYDNYYRLDVYVNWRTPKPLHIYYNVNGGTITKTTDGGTFTTDNSGTVLKNGNAVYNLVEYGTTLGNNGLNNYDNSAYMNITKSGYFVIEGTEWNTSSDGSGKSYSHSKEYSYNDFIDYLTEYDDYYRVDVYVNWKPQNPVRVYYNVNGGTITETTSAGTHSVDSSGFVIRNGSLFYQTFNYGTTVGADGLANYNNINYMYVTKTNYTTLYQQEWNSKADGSGDIYGDGIDYSYNELVKNATDKGSYYRLDLYINWRDALPVRVYYNVNGGTVTETTNAGTHSVDNQGFVIRNGSLFYQSFNYNTTTGSSGLANYNSADYMLITKSGYYAFADSAWKTSSGATFGQATEYSYTNLMEYADIDGGTYYRLNLYVNWVAE